MKGTTVISVLHDGYVSSRAVAHCGDDTCPLCGLPCALNCVAAMDIDADTADQRWVVLVIDDHAMIRQGVKALIEQTSDFAWAGEADNAAAGIQLAEKIAPDLVIVDVQLDVSDARRTSGIETTRSIRTLLPTTRVLVFTMYDDPDTVMRAVQAGAHGYLLKGANVEQTLAAMRVVARGGVLLPPVLAEAMQRAAEQTRPDHGKAKLAFPELTPKQRELLAWLAKGKSYKQIAELMQLTPHTVRNYASNIFEIIHAEDKVQAALIARDRGLT
jgi:DNA-binding NarL/FixJ family response regulator